MSATQNMVIDRGSTFRLSVQYTDSAEDPVDLTGYGASFRIFTKGAATASTTWACAVNSSGFITLAVTDETTQAMTSGRFVYGLYLENPAGEVDKIMQGQLPVRGGGEV